MDKRKAIQSCLGHYLKNNPGAREKLAQFCGVGLRAASDWGEQVFPKGETLVKLTVFLIESGFEIEGFDKKSDIYFVMQMIAHNQVDAKLVNEAMAYAETYQIYRIIFGILSISAVKEERLKTFVKPYRQQLKKETDDNDLSKKDFLLKFLHLSNSLKEIEPMLDKYLVATPAQRQELRDELDVIGSSFFKTSNILYRMLNKLNLLCSEKSLNNQNTKPWK